jgi:hypothetical protein
MARKVHTKKERTREEFLAAKSIGGSVPMSTSHGTINLNIVKHFCLHKPYENDEFEAIMFAEMKRRREAYEKSRAEVNNG